MKSKKPLYLLLALLLPILIFLFLKFAGRNEFNIPVFYEQGVMDSTSVCDQVPDKPYTVRRWQGIPEKAWRPANVVLFPQEGFDPLKAISRLGEEFSSEELSVIDACRLDSAECARWRRCVFYAPTTRETILFDKSGRIRGYYDLRTREEEDRLRVELKVLLKKY